VRARAARQRRRDHRLEAAAGRGRGRRGGARRSRSPLREDRALPRSGRGDAPPCGARLGPRIAPQVARAHRGSVLEATGFDLRRDRRLPHLDRRVRARRRVAARARDPVPVRRALGRPIRHAGAAHRDRGLGRRAAGASGQAR
jgi:hypothetical protein